MLPRSAGHRGGGGRGESRQPILLANGSRKKPIFCYPLPVKPHPVQLHPRLHCLSKEVWERREVSHLFSCSSASLGTRRPAQAPPSGLMAERSQGHALPSGQLPLLAALALPTSAFCNNLGDTLAAICLSAALCQDLSCLILRASTHQQF